MKINFFSRVNHFAQSIAHGVQQAFNKTKQFFNDIAEKIKTSCHHFARKVSATFSSFFHKESEPAFETVIIYPPPKATALPVAAPVVETTNTKAIQPLINTKIESPSPVLLRKNNKKENIESSMKSILLDLISNRFPTGIAKSAVVKEIESSVAKTAAFDDVPTASSKLQKSEIKLSSASEKTADAEQIKPQLTNDSDSDDDNDVFYDCASSQEELDAMQDDERLTTSPSR